MPLSSIPSTKNKTGQTKNNYRVIKQFRPSPSTKAPRDEFSQPCSSVFLLKEEEVKGRPASWY